MPDNSSFDSDVIADGLVAAARALCEALSGLRFGAPVTHVYQPLDYAWAPHEAYLRRCGAGRKRVLFLGMNPGPWGMAQTGVPFGEIPAVRDWIGIREEVGKPENEHPKRVIDGFDCKRSEVSGRRLWGLFSERFPNSADFFADHFVVNFCPLVWMEESARNRTPDKLPAAEMAPVEEACLDHLRRVVDLLDPEWCVGVGKFATTKFERIRTDESNWKCATVLHPSPASPAANRGWAEAAVKQLVAQGVWEK
ncbi:uracil-DNA glycosylase family protein [Sulfuriroseicoccus oceanibius]|uniref:Single-stranded DNA-binding protein n=1 Tax=Sulfuriroseicoccus oceanibius TaxID=2707525 RepID=A0A7T7EYT8_9BACT|nr:uracil-DNA glycosylase family protein [Sulfuriroseicoccus oceanibius]QQL43672.1 single-stranded DNA-binding protein [Sulfuriroseicoccus oceanibius]